MADVERTCGAAMRRRQRRLRSMLRHEQQSVAMALAQALHHSAGPSKTMVVERRERQEGEVQDVYDAPRSQKTPLPGVRPGVPLDPGPPGDEAVAVGYAAASVPLLGAPSLADSSAEAIDGSTLSFLLQHALEAKRKEEEEAVETAELAKLEEKLAAAEERLLEVLRQDREEGTRVTRQTWSTLSRVEQLAVHWFLAKDAVGKRRVKRKKKKRKRRKLPRAPHPRCRRPCDLQRQVPAALRVLRVPRQTGGHSCCATETGTHNVLLVPGAVLGQGRAMPVVVLTGAYGSNTAEYCGGAAVAARRFLGPGRRHLCRGAETDSLGPVQDHRNSTVAVH